MTFRETLAALWRRKWIVVGVTVLAAIIGVIYLHRLTPDFVSQTVVRVSPVVSQAVTSGTLGTIVVDTDPTVITSAAVLGPAAKALGEPATALDGAVQQSTMQSTTMTSTVSIAITASGSTPESAQARAKAVAVSYDTYLDGVVTKTLADLQTRLQDASSQASLYQNQVRANPSDQIAATNLANALSTYNALSQSRTTLLTAGSSLSITTPAPVGSSTNPSALVVAALAILCGLIAGAGIALVRDRFDDRLRSADEIEPITGVPALGVLANDRIVARHRLALPAASAGRTALSEGIRSLRTTVQVLLPRGQGVVVITSVEPGDGKTFLSANLALSWARAGRKVILVGGDLRRPQVQAYFPDSVGGPGLGGLLGQAPDGRRAPNQARIVEALQPTSYRGLRILPAGESEMEPADALASEALARIVRYLTKLADIVVIDSPPALALADASVLAAHADGVLLLSSVNRTRRALIYEALEALKANGVNVFGVIANRSRHRLPKSYGSYYVADSSGHRPVRPRLSPVPLGDDDLDDLDLDELPDDDLHDELDRSHVRSSGRLRRDGHPRRLWADEDDGLDGDLLDAGATVLDHDADAERSSDAERDLIDEPDEVEAESGKRD